MQHTHTHGEAMQSPRTILELHHNDDPYGRGFVACESRDCGQTWHYRGDVGARSRAWWRQEARQLGAILREMRR